MHTLFHRLLILCLIVPVFHAFAEDAKTAQAATAPGDPFVKEKTSAKAASKPTDSATPPAGAPAAPLSTYGLFVFETYTLPQDALDALHTESPPDKAFYERIRKLCAEGEATLDCVTALPTRSGQRATSESIDELLYATEFDPPKAGRQYAYPTAHEMRPTGDRVEIDPVLNEDGSVDVNLAPESTRFHGFIEQKADPAHLGADGELQPLFSTRKVTTAVTCRPDVPFLLATQSAPANTGLAEAGDSAGKVSVTFLTARVVNVPLGTRPKNPDSSNMRFVFRVYSMLRGAARDVLTAPSDSDALHEQTLALPKDTLKLERILMFHTRSGQRATLEEIAENIYGTEMNPPHPPLAQEAIPEAKMANGTTVPHKPAVYDASKGELPGTFKAFEMRPLGWSIEVDPVLSDQGGVADLNLALGFTTHRGNLQGPGLLARYPQMPVFAAQKITTAVSASVGHQCFLGTLNAPRDTGVNGRKDDGRVWFAFVKVTMD